MDNINELAYKYKTNRVTANSKYALEAVSANLKDIFTQQKTILAGHNVKEFDLPILEEHAGLK